MNSTLLRRKAAWPMLAGMVCLCVYKSSPEAVDAAPAPPAVIASVAADPGVQKIAAANTQFGFQMLQQLNQKASGGNVFFSPLSISSALSVVLGGAGGQTRQSMAKTLALSGLTPDEIDRANGLLLPSLENPDPKVQISVANALWANQGTAFAPAFQERSRKFYQADAETLDFHSPAAAETINNWVAAHTEGKISQLVSPADIVNAPAVVTNAVYFHGLWQTPFVKSSTQDGTFRLVSGGTKTVPLMVQIDSFSYGETDQFQAISLPYGAGRMSFVVLLPEPGTDINTLVSGLTPSVWADIINGMKPTQVRMTLPRFNADFKATLNQPLTALGMGPAFMSTADFTPMGLPQMYIGAVVHKAVLEVDEKGTVAAAATGATYGAGGRIPSPKKEMRVDHPFLCAIRDNETGTLLFVGVIRDPQ